MAAKPSTPPTPYPTLAPAGDRYPTPAHAAADGQEPAPFRADPVRQSVCPGAGDSKFDTSKQHNPGRRRLISPANDDQAAGDPGDEGTGQPGGKQLEGPQSPQLTIQKSAPPEIQVGKPATFRITVRNTGQSTAGNVEVHDQIPRGTHLLGSTPRASRGADRRAGLELGHDQAGRRICGRDATHAHRRGRNRQRSHGPFRCRGCGPLHRHQAKAGGGSNRHQPRPGRRSGEPYDNCFQSRQRRGQRRGHRGTHPGRLAAPGRQRPGIRRGRSATGREPQAGPATHSQASRTDHQRAYGSRRRQAADREPLQFGSGRAAPGRCPGRPKTPLPGARSDLSGGDLQPRHRPGAARRAGRLFAQRAEIHAAPTIPANTTRPIGPSIGPWKSCRPTKKAWSNW